MAASRLVIYVLGVRTGLSARALAIDVALAIGAATAQLVGTIRIAGAEGRPLDAAGVTLLLASGGVLALRRAWPVTTLAATTLVALIYNFFDYPSAFWTVAIAIALYTAVAAGRRIPSIAIIGVAFVAFLVTDAFLKRGHFTDPTGALWFLGWLVASFVAGEVSRARSAYLEEAERRVIEAERTREEEALRRASEERVRIARELHDVLAHNISLINVQAGVALHLLDRQPESARPALVAITQASKDALRELRATLDVLRGADEDDPRAPAPSLQRLDELVAKATAAGVGVRLNVTGGTRPLPPGVDLAAYRIAQESLTNVARHARPPTATLSIDYRTAELVIEVEDDGREKPTATAIRSGHGLIGMRERAASVGGELEAGPRPEGGFRVRARLPLNGAA